MRRLFEVFNKLFGFWRFFPVVPSFVAAVLAATFVLVLIVVRILGEVAIETVRRPVSFALLVTSIVSVPSRSDFLFHNQ